MGLAAATVGGAHRLYERDPRLGLPDAGPPGGSPPPAAQVHLGRALFFDSVLSRDDDLACATCHTPGEGFSTPAEALELETRTIRLKRNPPSLLNVAYQRRLFVDGRAGTLESQVLQPLFGSGEMANESPQELVAELSGMPRYRRLFQDAFGEAPSVPRLAEALAAFERTLIAGGSRFDRWYYAGEAGALTAIEKEGFRLFVGRAGCVHCHFVGEEASLFTDHAYHNTGVGLDGVATNDTLTLLYRQALDDGARRRQRIGDYFARRGLDVGRYGVTHEIADVARFKTPSLRNVALTGPYMHDGSMATLREVVLYYNAGGHTNPWLDPRIWPLYLSESEVEALVAFLESLTSPYAADLMSAAGPP